MLRHALRRCLPAVALLLACSTDEGARDPTNVTSPTGITSATMPGSGPSTGGSDTDPGPGDTGPTTGMAGAEAGSDPGPDPVTDSGLVTGTEDTGVGTTNFDPPPTGDYAATYIPGDQNHLSVRKASVEGDWCATITFVAPQDMGPLEYGITLPATWQVQGALIHQGAADCLSFAGFPGEPIMAISGNGTATWAGACPTALDIDLTLAFPAEQPWTPGEVLLQSKAVAISGC